MSDETGQWQKGDRIHGQDGGPEPQRFDGQVRAIRQVKGGVQAEVCVGWSERGAAWLQVTAADLEVMKALEALQEALRASADKTLLAAQASVQARGRKAIGVAS